MLTDNGAAALERAQTHLRDCGTRTMLDPPCDAHALATDVIALHQMLRGAVTVDEDQQAALDDLRDRLAVEGDDEGVAVIAAILAQVSCA